MGRNRIKKSEKAVKVSITIQPTTYKSLMEKVVGGKKLSRAINDTLVWYVEIMGIISSKQQQILTPGEMETLETIFPRVRTGPGQLVSFKKKISSFFGDSLTEIERSTIEERFDVPVHLLNEKLSTLSDFELVWLYVQLEYLSEKTKQKKKNESISSERGET